MNANSSSGSRRRMMYDVPLVPGGFAAFQAQRQVPAAGVERHRQSGSAGPAAGAGDGGDGGGIWAVL